MNNLQRSILSGGVCEGGRMNNLQLTVNFEIPDGAKWLAQDQDGYWWAYETCPNIYEGASSRNMWDSQFDSKHVGHSAPNPDWRNELYSLEWEYE